MCWPDSLRGPDEFTLHAISWEGDLMERVFTSTKQIGFLFLALGLLLGSSAQAFTISGVSAVTNPGDSGAISSGDINGDSQTSVTNAGGSTAETVGATMTAGTRYGQFLAADNSWGNSYASSTADYTVTMNITPDDANTIYDLQIDTTRLGALTLVDDDFYACCYSSADIGSVAGSVGGVADAGLSMGALGINSSPTNLEIDQVASITLSGLSGNYTLVLDFVWTADAWSNNHEGAVRLGLVGTGSGVSADDYPGVGGRTLAGDGHFVDVTATVTSVIPEPTTALLVGLGLAGLALRRPRA